MTPFHASELLAKNSSILTRLTYEQKLSLLKYIILNDPDPGLVLELELLPLANNQFITFQTKQASMIYIVDHNPRVSTVISCPAARSISESTHRSEPLRHPIIEKLSR